MVEGKASQDHCVGRLRVVHLKTLMIDGSSVTSNCIAIANLLVNHVDKYKGEKELKMVYWWLMWKILADEIWFLVYVYN